MLQKREKEGKRLCSVVSPGEKGEREGAEGKKKEWERK